MIDFADEKDWIFFFGPLAYFIVLIWIYFAATPFYAFGTLGFIRHQALFQRTKFWKAATLLGMCIPLLSIGLLFWYQFNVFTFPIVLTILYVILFWYDVFKTPKSIFYLSDEIDNIEIELGWFFTVDNATVEITKSLLEFYLPGNGPESAIRKEDLPKLAQFVDPKKENIKPEPVHLALKLRKYSTAASKQTDVEETVEDE